MKLLEEHKKARKVLIEKMSMNTIPKEIDVKHNSNDVSKFLDFLDHVEEQSKKSKLEIGL